MFHKWDVVGIHEDRAISGAKCTNRPGLEAAIAQAIKEKAVLMVYSLSRLTRTTRDAIMISERLDKSKANLCSVTENIDTTTAMGSAFFQIIAVLAELERKQLSERTRDAMHHHQANGRRMSHLLPYGWHADPDDPARMLPDKEELEIIEIIKDCKVRGFSLRATGEHLEWNKIFARNGKRFSHKTIGAILNRCEREVF